MPDVPLVFRESRWETPTIRSFHFEPQAAFGRAAGQYLMMKLDVQDPRGPYRSFTIASSPTESEVMIATRVVGRSPFKQKLVGLEPGASLTVKAPLGKFTLHQDARFRAVFIAGGIGITPFRSMIRYATDEGLPMDLVLLYSCRSQEEIAFRAELDAWREKNEHLRITYTLTRATEGWEGRRGRVDTAMIREEAGSADDAVFYVCGRPEFVSELRAIVMGMGVPRERVLSEQFPGYAATPAPS